MDEEEERKHRHWLWEVDYGGSVKTKANEIKTDAGTRRMQVTYGFVVRAAFAGTGIDVANVTADVLVRQAASLGPEFFPEGLTLEQAQYMLDHWGEVMPGEDVLP